jgi:hypothetical protein
MGEIEPCIYCDGIGPRTDEHVLQEAFGGPRVVLREDVCAEGDAADRDVLGCAGRGAEADGGGDSRGGSPTDRVGSQTAPRASVDHCTGVCDEQVHTTQRTVNA